MGLFSLLFRNKKDKKKRVIKPKEFIYFREEYNDLIYKTNIDFSNAIELVEKNICGNCGSILEAEIENNRKCPECKEPIIIRSDVISKKKVQLNKKNMMDFLEYDREARKLIFMENLMKRYDFLYSNNKELFYSCKQNYKEAKYVIKEFANACNVKLEKDGFSKFERIVHYDVDNHFNDWYEMLTVLTHSIQANMLYLELANYDEQYEIAYNMLDVVAFQSAQLVPLYKKFYQNIEHINEQELIHIPSKQILKFLKENNYTIDDFHSKFMQGHHHFLINILSNEEAWICIERALRKCKINN